MNELFLVLFILLITLTAINLTSIIINHYIIKAEINSIIDKKLRLYLLSQLQPIYKTFFTRVIISADKDYFFSIEAYISYQSYLNISNVSYEQIIKKEYRDKEVMILEEDLFS